MAHVLVACKLPHGLWMEIVTPGVDRQPAVRGTRVRLNGANSKLVGAALNPLVAQFGMTEVDETFAKAWFDRYKDSDFIKSGAVFMATKAADATAEAKIRVNDVKSGFEPISQDNDGKGTYVDKRLQADVASDAEHLNNLGITL